jgi:hypothetical protein
LTLFILTGGAPGFLSLREIASVNCFAPFGEIAPESGKTLSQESLLANGLHIVAKPFQN